MLFPSKHIKVAESLWGLGGVILDITRTPKTLDAIWHDYSLKNNSKEFPANHPYDHLLLAMGFLFSVDLIELSEDGTVSRK